MAVKTFEFENLSFDDVIVVTSKNHVIDFSKVSTTYTAYFNDSLNHNYTGHAELLISNNNQRLTTIFQLPVEGQKMKLEISTQNYDVDDLIVQPKQ